MFAFLIQIQINLCPFLGKEDSCSKDGQNKCDKISNCPVGYWPMLPDSTCYKDSAGKIQELVNTLKSKFRSLKFRAKILTTLK